jgi:MoaA/NifB/PqqE/SkfB family radical SAM enzyme
VIVPRPLLRAVPRALAAAFDTTRPVLAQLVVTRRCNLACGYCFEYDDHSLPVPLELLLERVDQLAGLGTIVLTLTGGEPLLHPELDRLVARAVERGSVCTLISNGYPLTQAWVERLNRARLTALQLSIDGLEPNATTQKSWSRLERPLRLLRQHARFAVNVNAVLGACPPDELRGLAQRVRDHGFYMTVGLMNDAAGQLVRALAGSGLESLAAELGLVSRKSPFHLPGEGWEAQLLREGAAPWRCRAGARFLYVDELGRVSYCSQRREPAVPLPSWDRPRRRAAFLAAKGCEPGCTQACVRRASAFDEWRRWRHPRIAAPEPVD